MTHYQQPLPEVAENAPFAAVQQEQEHPKSCPQCGGSGALRLADQRFRTYLTCLGQGQLTAARAATTVAEVLQLDSRGLSAAVSSAVAR